MKPLNFDMIICRHDVQIEVIKNEHPGQWIKDYARMMQVKNRDIKIQTIKDKLILKNSNIKNGKDNSG